MMKDLTNVQKKLGKILRVRIQDDNVYIGIMANLILNQSQPDNNCEQLLSFLENYPNADTESIFEEALRIIA